MIELSDITFAYPQGGFKLRAEALSIEPGQQVAVVGPSGSGKTTLLNLVAGVLVPDGGTVRVDGRAVSSMPDKARRRFRRSKIGMVFQGVELIDYLSVRENVMLPFRLGRALGGPAEWGPSADAMLDRVGLGGLTRRRAGRLSAGERQRVGLCRALVATPPIVLADEPTSALDEGNTTAVMDAMMQMTRDNGVTLVMLTHDKALLPRFDRVVTVDRGVVS